MTKTAKVLALKKKGMSHAKIAKKLKCPIGHVHSIVWKANRDAKSAPAKRRGAADIQPYVKALEVAEKFEVEARGLLARARLVRTSVALIAEITSK